MLVRRIIPVVVALALAGAPVALEACQASCATHAEMMASTVSDAHHAAEADRPSADQPMEHSCHHPVESVSVDSGATDPGVALTGGPHTCGHSDDLPVTGGAQGAIAFHAPAVLTPIAYLFPVIERTHTFVHTTFSRDSVPIALTLPLRV